MVFCVDTFALSCASVALSGFGKVILSFVKVQVVNVAASRVLNLVIIVGAVMISIFSPSMFPLGLLDPNGECLMCSGTGSETGCSACAGRLFSMKLMLSVSITYGIFSLMACISDHCSITSSRGSWIQKIVLITCLFTCLEFIPARLFIMVGYVLHFAYLGFLVFFALEVVGMSYAAARFIQEFNSEEYDQGDISRPRACGLFVASMLVYCSAAAAMGTMTINRMIHDVAGEPCHGAWTCAISITYVCLWSAATLFISILDRVRECRRWSGMVHASLMCMLVAIMVSLTLTSEPKWFTRGCHIPSASHAKATFAGEPADFVAFMMIEIIILFVAMCNEWRCDDHRGTFEVGSSSFVGLGEDFEVEPDSRRTALSRMAKLLAASLALAHIVVCGCMPIPSRSGYGSLVIPTNHPWFSIENAMGSLLFGIMYAWFLVAPIAFPDREF
jgi:hypothetical protein